MRRLLIAIIRVYQYAISPYLPPSCRYTPSCSSYAIEAVERFGVFRGSWLALRRVSRCHPWHEGGYDPCPENKPGHECESHHHHPVAGDHRESVINGKP